MQFHIRSMAVAMFAILAFTACKKDTDDPIAPTPPVNEEEMITTVRIHLHSTGGTEHKVFTHADLDGDGGDPPVISAEALSTDTTYHVTVEFLNESVDPAEDITEEIEEEGEEHQIFFLVSGANVAIAYADTDANGHPIGLQSTWVAGAASSGMLNVVLRHEPHKDAPGVSTGDITNAGGDTDISVEFPLVVM